MSFQRRAYDMDLGRRDHTRWLGSSGRYSTGGFAYADIPNQLLRINSLEGSLAFSGGTLTGVTDVSAAGETVNVTGSPTYTATDAGLNNAPSFTIVAASSVIAPNVNRASIRFVAAVVYRTSTSVARYIFDGDEASGRLFVIIQPTLIQVSTGATLTAPTSEPLLDRKIWLAPNDNATQIRWNPGVGLPTQDIGTQPVGSASGNGISLAQSYVSGTGIGNRMAFFMACSAVPDATARAALEAKLITDFG